MSSSLSSSDDEPAPRKVRLRPMTAREKEWSKKRDEERKVKRHAQLSKLPQDAFAQLDHVGVLDLIIKD